MLATQVAVEMDKLGVQGDGVGSNPTGVANVTGIGALTYPLTGDPALADIVNIESEVEIDNVAMGNMVYLVGPVLAAKLKTVEKATNTGLFILENGMMNGRPVVVSSNVPQ